MDAITISVANLAKTDVSILQLCLPLRLPQWLILSRKEASFCFWEYQGGFKGCFRICFDDFERWSFIVVYIRIIVIPLYCLFLQAYYSCRFSTTWVVESCSFSGISVFTVLEFSTRFLLFSIHIANFSAFCMKKTYYF